MVGHTTTDIVAYANNDVFVQAWIGVEDKLPRMLRAVYRADPARLRHQLELSEWRLDPPVAAEVFAPRGAAGATTIPFASPRQKARTDPKPPVKAKPSKGT